MRVLKSKYKKQYYFQVQLTLYLTKLLWRFHFLSFFDFVFDLHFKKRC